MSLLRSWSTELEAAVDDLREIAALVQKEENDAVEFLLAPFNLT